MIAMKAETLFWIVHLPLMVFFLVGMGFVVRLWLRGYIHYRVETTTTWHKIKTLLKCVFKIVFSLEIFLILKYFIIDVWFNYRLWQNNRWRWLNHFLLLTGFMLLTILSTASVLSDKIFNPYFHLNLIWSNQDNPIVAILNEVGGLLMSMGLLFFLIRRFVPHRNQSRTGFIDDWMIFSLAFIMLSGWTTEIVRLNSSCVQTTAQFRFIGSFIAHKIITLHINWDSAYNLMFIAHGLFASLVIASIPFSKFVHSIAGSLIILIRKYQDRRIVKKEETYDLI